MPFFFPSAVSLNVAKSFGESYRNKWRKSILSTKENKSEFLKLLAKESGITDPVVAGLIHEEIVKLYSDTGIISEEALRELIASSKEVLKSSKEISTAEIADFSFARKAWSEIREAP